VIYLSKPLHLLSSIFDMPIPIHSNHLNLKDLFYSCLDEYKYYRPQIPLRFYIYYLRISKIITFILELGMLNDIVVGSILILIGRVSDNRITTSNRM
ncbi:MAG TPA: hypothetical protein VFY41_06700, partial [Nitrososphaeraceae archaeon]|nr:hypothetical protein [Nitrososphaeraceae archaeon]